jgi:hypothetical protein
MCFAKYIRFYALIRDISRNNRLPKPLLYVVVDKYKRLVNTLSGDMLCVSINQVVSLVVFVRAF